MTPALVKDLLRLLVRGALYLVALGVLAWLLMGRPRHSVRMYLLRAGIAMRDAHGRER